MKLLRFEQGFTVLGLLAYTEAILLLVLSGGAGQEDVGADYDTSLYRLSFIVIYLVTGVLLARHWKHTLYTLLRSPLIFVVVGLSAVSVAWSWTPDATVKQSIALIGSSMFGLYLATRYSLKQQLHLLGWTFGIIAVLSVVFAVLLPQYGVMGGIHAGAWRGVFMHKNGLGGRMTTSVIIFSILMFSVRQYRWIPGGGALLSMALIVLSRSTSALLNTVFLLMALAILQVIRWRYRSRMLAIALLTLTIETLMVMFVVYAEDFANFLGKDLTLTGRTDLWQITWEMIQRYPWLGYGYDGFWHGLEGPSVTVWLATGWKMTHPHNGFLALWLDLGILGLTLFLIGFFRSLYRALIWLRSSGDAEAFFPVAHLMFLVLANLTESSLLVSNFIPWVLYVSVSLATAKELERRNRTVDSDVSESKNLQKFYFET